MEEKKNRFVERIRNHKRKILTALAVIAAVFVVAAAAFAVIRLQTFSSYEVLSSYEHSRESNDQYVKFNGNLVQYGGDGIICLKADGSSLWSKSYEMEQPILAASDHYLALTDQGGSEILLFDADGILREIETPYPVLQIALAGNGNVAAVLQGSDECRIVLYDKTGALIVEGSSHLDDSGYPAAVALSSDGTIMAVSYLTVDTGAVSSVLTFYDLSESESGTARIAASESCEGEMIVRLAQLDGNFAAFSGSGVRIYSADTLSLKREITAEEEIQSIAVGDDRFALIYRADEEEALAAAQEDADQTASGDAQTAVDAYVLQVYGSGGRELYSTVFTDDYQEVTFLENGSTAICGTDFCKVINILGKTQFSYSFGETLCGIFSNRFFGYTLVFTDRVERIRLK